MTFTISAPPHKKEEITVKKIIWGRIFALIPISLVSIYFFGLPAIGMLLATILTAVATEVIIEKVFDKKSTVMDGSAILIGLMLALVIPPEAPIWMPMLAALFAVSVGKHAFGGNGSYVFNPVLVGWMLLSLSWGSLMVPVSYPQTSQITDLFFESGAGLLVDVSPLLLLTGIYLIYRRYADWRVPLAFFLTTTLLAVLFGDSLSYVFIGPFIFAVLFLSTDGPSSPVTRKGRLIYGVVCGVLVFVYGHFANYMEAVFYGLFLANCVSSLIDANTLPGSYGTRTYMQRQYARIIAKVPFKDRLGVMLDE